MEAKYRRNLDKTQFGVGVVNNGRSSKKKNYAYEAVNVLVRVLGNYLQGYTERILDSDVAGGKEKRIRLGQVLNIFKEKLKNWIRVWVFETIKSKKFKSGLEKLNSVEVKNHKKKMKMQKEKDNDLNLVFIEKAMTKVLSFFNRKVRDLKFEVWVELNREVLKMNRIDWCLWVRKRNVERKILNYFRNFVTNRKIIRSEGIKNILNIENKELRKIFNHIVKRNDLVPGLNLRIMFGLFEKLLNRRKGEVLRKIADGRNERSEVLMRKLCMILLDKAKFLAAYGLSKFKRNSFKRLMKKSGLAIEKLHNLLRRKFKIMRFSLKCYLTQDKIIRTLKGYQYLIPLQRKIMNQVIQSLKPRNYKKFELPIKILFIKFGKPLRNTQKVFIKSLIINKNLSRIEKSSSMLLNILNLKFKSIKKVSMKSMISYINNKKRQLVLWKIKFYQLEGLIQHKKEEISLKAKFKHLRLWKTHTTKLSRHHKKQLKINLSNLINSLDTLHSGFTTNLKFSSFLILKLRYLRERASLYTLTRIYQKIIKTQAFKRFLNSTCSNRVFSPAISPTPLSPSNHSTNSNTKPSKFLSPPFQHKSIPSLHLKPHTSSRYGFYSTKNPNDLKCKSKVIKITRAQDTSSQVLIEKFEEFMRNSYEFSSK